MKTTRWIGGKLYNEVEEVLGMINAIKFCDLDTKEEWCCAAQVEDTFFFVKSDEMFPKNT